MAEDDNPGTYALMQGKNDADDIADEPAPFSKQQYVMDSSDAVARQPQFQGQGAYPNLAVEPQYPPGYPSNAVDYVAVPMYNTPVYEDDGTYQAMSQYPADRFIVPVRIEEDPSCALCGLLFSWIPIIGWITCFVNFNARPGSRRKAFGRLAGSVASAVFVLTLILGVARSY
jgi:hypothetical protein